jgi:prepilin peptidase CpaA
VVGERPKAAPDSLWRIVLQTVISFVGIALFIVAAYGDVKSFRIPNLLVAAVALLGVTRLVAVGDPSAALYTVGASVIVLVIGFVLFWQGIIGGGDAKLITAAVLLVGYHDLPSFLVFMSICGALISLAAFVTHWQQQKPTAKLYVPYGVAIATAGSVTLLFQSPFVAALLFPHPFAVTLLLQSTFATSFIG